MHAFFYKQHFYKQRQAGKIGKKIKQKLSNTPRLNFCYLKFIRCLHPRYHLNLRSSCRSSSGRVQKYWIMSFVCIHVLIFYWWINNSWTVYHTLGKVLELSVLFIKGDFFSISVTSSTPLTCKGSRRTCKFHFSCWSAFGYTNMVIIWFSVAIWAAGSSRLYI